MMERPPADMLLPFHRRWPRLAVALCLLATLVVVAGLQLWDGRLGKLIGMSSETAGQAMPNPQQDVPKAKPAEEADRTFTANYDAEKIANFYGAKYQRNTDYLLTIVHHAAAVAKENDVSPFILLAIISHESNFLHTARNNSGAEGLMQIMTNVHKKRFERYGGIRMTYVPEVNIRVGATILRECIDIMKSVRGGLRCYAGTINSDDGGFVDFVLGEATLVKKMASLPTAQASR